MSTLSFPPPLAFGGSGSVSAVQMPPPPDNSSSSPTSSIIIVIIIIASAVIVSASIYLIIRFLSRRLHGSFRTFAAADDVVLEEPRCHVAEAAHSGLLDSLPLFTFRSVTGNLSGGDCAVCLSKFEPHDQLRLLPLCCHAFHAACIDAWIVSNQTCPLCRSAVLPSDSDALDKILSAGGINNNHTNSSNNLGNRNRNSGSFRIEIGSISRRRGASDSVEGEQRRSYSIGSFDYILDDNGYEIPVGSITHHRRDISDSTSIDKESSIGIPIPEPPGEVIASEVSGGRNWLRDYVDRLASVSFSSRALSFRSSGRFFTGSSRRSDPPAEDVEANRAGEEISELFRWLSGI